MTSSNLEICHLPKGGNNQSFGVEWKENYHVLLNLARRMSYRTSQEADDILSQATVKVLAYTQKNNEIKSFPSLMRLSIKQVFLDNKRNHRDRVFLESCEFDQDYSLEILQNVAPFAEHQHCTKETLVQVLKYVYSLSSTDQELFHLRFIDEYSFHEISQMTALTEVNARKKISTLRNKLSTLIKD